jgi:hypothetical protein
MAKALFGHVGGAPDRRLVDEVTQLRAKVRALEFEVVRLRADPALFDGTYAELNSKPARRHPLGIGAQSCRAIAPSHAVNMMRWRRAVM